MTYYQFVYEFVQLRILPSHMYKFLENTNDIRFCDILLVFYHELQRHIKQNLLLVEQMNKWSSTIRIPQGDEYLDISSAAMGKLSTTPIGDSNQPFTFPKGKSASVYQFDSKIFNENSWPMLKDMLTKVGCASGCRLTVSHVAFRKTCNCLAMYTLCCTHGVGN